MENTKAEIARQAQQIRRYAGRHHLVAVSRQGRWMVIDEKTHRPFPGMEWLTPDEAVAALESLTSDLVSA